MKCVSDHYNKMTETVNPTIKSFTLDWSRIKDPKWISIFNENAEHLKLLNVEIENDIKKFNGYFDVYPPQNLVFNLFEKLNFDDVKVVILGQDPYISPGEAMGLSFSVPPTQAIPASLRNMFKELASDLPQNATHSNGDLTSWVNQGVFLLNNSLTVRQGQSNSHAAFKQPAGSKQKFLKWSDFTDAIIKKLSDERENLVFVLWGKAQREKAGSLIDKSKHCIIESVHPSPLSANGGFFGSKPFSKTNQYLEKVGKTPIDW